MVSSYKHLNSSVLFASFGCVVAIVFLSGSISRIAVAQSDENNFPKLLKLELSSDQVHTLKVSELPAELMVDGRRADAYIVPERCDTSDDALKKHLAADTSCDSNIVQFSLSQPGQYDFTVLEPSRLVIATCMAEDADCLGASEFILIQFISDLVLEKNAVHDEKSLETINRVEVLESIE